MRKILGSFLCLALTVSSALTGSAAETVDIAQLQARLAANEARMNDLQEKTYSRGATSYEGLVSLNKNAVVTVGGTVNTRYFYRNAKIKSIPALVPAAPNPAIPLFDYSIPTFQTWAKASEGKLGVSDAKVKLDIKVNEYFGAFLQMDLQSSGSVTSSGDSDNAEKYYVYWNNVCQSGFGLLVGRDSLKFGQGDNPGVLATYVSSDGDGLADVTRSDQYFTAPETAAFMLNPVAAGYFNMGLIAPHNGWDLGRITQVTPYWEGLDGKLRFELSLFQNLGSNSGNAVDENQYLASGDMVGFNPYNAGGNDYRYYKNADNGLGSFSGRIIYKPIEGLKVSASILNFYSGYEQFLGSYQITAKSNTAVDLAVGWRPAFMNRLFVWGEWVHGWNAGNLKGWDTDAVNFGAMFNITDRLAVFAQGDYLHGSTDNLAFSRASSTAWAAYGGIKYALPYGVSLEAGWKHEWVKWSNAMVSGDLMKAQADTIYGHLGFDF